MLSRTTLRGKPATATNRVVGLLAVLWLNMILLPCAMAIPGNDDCPHCPPAENHDMMSHQGRGTIAHHEHGQRPDTPPCATVQPDCCDDLVGNVDIRGGKEADKPAAQFVLMVPRVPSAEAEAAAEHHCAASDPPRVSVSPPPPHVLFCVYLD